MTFLYKARTPRCQWESPRGVVVGEGGGAGTLVISSPPFKVRKVLYYLGALL